MQKQRLIIFILGSLLALGAILTLQVYISQLKQKSEEEKKQVAAQVQENQAAVLIAKEDIPRGAAVTPDLFAPASIPTQYVAPQAVSIADRVLGMVTIAPIAKGEQVTLSKLAQSSRGTGKGLADSTPIGKRAITISVDNMASLVGMLNPGDYVDIIALVPIPTQDANGKQASQVAVVPLFQNVLVLAIGRDTGGAIAPAAASRYAKPEDKSELSPFITLALSPQESSLVAFVQEQGKLRLVLRSPADSQITMTAPASWDTLFALMAPKESEKPKIKEAPPEPSEFVEVYRGLSKEKIPLTK